MSYTSNGDELVELEACNEQETFVSYISNTIKAVFLTTLNILRTTNRLNHVVVHCHN